jgi:hypothetical protein
MIPSTSAYYLYHEVLDAGALVCAHDPDRSPAHLKFGERGQNRTIASKIVQ